MPGVRRREFLTLIAVSPALTSCGSPSPVSPSPSPPATTGVPSPPPSAGTPLPSGEPVGLVHVPAAVDGRELVVQVAGTPLATVGGAARTDGAVGGLHHYVLLARTSTDRVAALNGTCTHEGCVINRLAQPAFECPCHGSRFDEAGRVVRGPAAAALPALAVVFDGQTARVRVAQ